MNRRADLVARALARANGLDAMTENLQRLKRDHDFVVFDEVAGEEEDVFHLLRLTKFRSGVKLP